MAKESNNDRWLTVRYQPVSLFSLKRSDATSMAARSNLVPTPYSIKMALLRILLESQGNQHSSDFANWIKQEFNWIKSLKVLIQPPERLVVNRNGYKLRYQNQQADKDYRKENVGEVPSTMPMQDGFVFREWIYYEGELTICCGPTPRLTDLEGLFAQINYFGKRGCFFQYLPLADEEKYSLEASLEPELLNGFTVQPMDDLGEKTTFEKISPFSSESAKLGKDRVIPMGMLPLKLISTSARYDLYQRCDDAD